MYYFKRVRAFLRGWKDQPSKKEVKQLLERYKELTAEMTDLEAINLIDGSGDYDLVTLCRIAEYADMGKLQSIIYSFKLGYLAGKAGADHETHL